MPTNSLRCTEKTLEVYTAKLHGVITAWKNDGYVYFLWVISCIFQIFLFYNQKYRRNKEVKKKMMQEKSCNILFKTLANGLLGKCRISVKPHLGLQKSPLGLCWHHPPCLHISRAWPGARRVVRMEPPVCVVWATFLPRLASVTPHWEGPTEKSCHFRRNGPSLNCFPFWVQKFVFAASFWKSGARCRNSLVVQWLGLCASTAGGPGLISGWGTKILQAVRCGQKKKKKWSKVITKSLLWV